MPPVPPSKKGSGSRRTRQRSAEGGEQAGKPGACPGEEELAALERFCKGVENDDVSFECWNSTHTDLDLIIPLWLSRAELTAGGERTLRFSRRETPCEGAQPTRIPASCVVVIPPNSHDGESLRIQDLGDISGTRSGALIIKFHAKN